MSKNQKFLIVLSFIFFNFLLAKDLIIEKENIFSIDLSVYDGDGALLLIWSYPDSVQPKNIKIYRRNSEQFKFSLISNLDYDKNRYLDLNCKPELRFFYKVEIEDIFGKYYTSDFNTPSFGSCEFASDTLLMNPNIQSLKDLALSEILDLTKLEDPSFEYSEMIKMLRNGYSSENEWLEKFPIELLRESNDQIRIFDRLIQSSEWLERLLEKKSFYSNLFLLTPNEWEKECLFTIQRYRHLWNELYLSYFKAISSLEDIEPLRIVSYNISKDFQKRLSVYIFNQKNIDLTKAYILSNREYININDYKLYDQNLIHIDFPKDWNSVNLMYDDSLLQICNTIFDSSVFYTLQGDIISFDSTYSFKMSYDKSSIWINEIMWSSNSKQLHLEIAGKASYDTSYSIFVNNQILWKLEDLSNFDFQYSDSLFKISDDISFPIVLKLKESSYDKNKILEHHLLDTASYIKNRKNDYGKWIDSKNISFGKSNKINQSNNDQKIIPDFFILYQNYPNPFNGLTKITFDLLEDAMVSLYVTDATGRVYDKFLENEYVSAGKYSYNWNGEKKSTGIYFFTIRVAVKNQLPTVLSRKMIYLK